VRKKSKWEKWPTGIWKSPKGINWESGEALSRKNAKGGEIRTPLKKGVKEEDCPELKAGVPKNSNCGKNLLGNTIALGPFGFVAKEEANK